MPRQSIATGTTKKRGAKKQPSDQASQTDSMFAAATAAAKETFGASVLVGSANEIAQVGLPLPALAVRWLFQANIFPLGRIWQLAGQEGSCKSALLFELLRWHAMYGGGGTVIEVENKESEVLMNGVLEYRPEWIENRVKTIYAASLNEWQLALTNQMIAFSTHMDKKGGPGRTVPVLFGIDSLTAADTQDNIDKVTKDGFASRGYAEQANLISRYMRTITSRLRNFPFSIIGTNHMKPATDYLGRPTSNIPGGKAVPFMATYMIESSRVADIDTANYAGVRLGLKMAKNSMGPSRRWIEVEFIWWWAPDPVSGQPRQHFYWDWDTATVEMLLAFENRIKAKKTLFNEICDITGLEVIRSQKLAYSKVLGIPQSDPVSYRDWAKALEKRPDVLAQLYPKLGIGTYNFFQPGVDFRIAQEQAQQEATKASQTLYANTDQLQEVDDLDEDVASEEEGGTAEE